MVVFGEWKMEVMGCGRLFLFFIISIVELIDCLGVWITLVKVKNRFKT